MSSKLSLLQYLVLVWHSEKYFWFLFNRISVSEAKLPMSSCFVFAGGTSQPRAIKLHVGFVRWATQEASPPRAIKLHVGFVR